MKRKLLATFLLASMTLSTVFCSGCGSSSGDDANVTTIKWMFWDDLETSEDKTTLGYGQVIERFNEQFKGKYKCEPITVTLAEYPTKLNSYISGGEAPDLFMCDPGPKLDAYVAQGATTNMTEILEKDPTWRDSFDSSFFKAISYDNQLMAIPTNFASACVFYNKKIFQEAGVEIPKTYAELLQVCKKIKDKKITPLTISAGTNWCVGMLAGYLCEREGGPNNLTGVKNGTVKWTDPSFKNAATKLLELSQYFQENAEAEDNNVATENFYTGKAAMLVQGSWVIGQIKGATEATDPEFQKNCGIFKFPAIEGSTGDPNSMVVKTDNICMSKTTKNQEACIELLKMFTNDEAQKYTAEVAGKMPVTKVQYDETKAPEQLKDVKAVLAQANGNYLGFYNETLPTSEAGDKFNDAMVAVCTKKQSVDEALTDLNKYFEEKVWKKAK